MAATLVFASRSAPVVPGPLDEALWYARSLGWPVRPGDPGPDGATVPPRAPATTDPRTVSALWERFPQAPVLLATGAHFDVLDVPGAAGTRALHRAERAGVPVGPVAATSAGRIQFFVSPGVADDLPALLDWLDWGDLGLDLRAFGTGGVVDAPSPWPATWRAPWPRAWERARWLRCPVTPRRPGPGPGLDLRPGPEHDGTVLSLDAVLHVDVRMPDVTRLLSTLADSCQHVRLFPRQRTGRTPVRPSPTPA